MMVCVGQSFSGANDLLLAEKNVQKMTSYSLTTFVSKGANTLIQMESNMELKSTPVFHMVSWVWNGESPLVGY